MGYILNEYKNFLSTTTKIIVIDKGNINIYSNINCVPKQYFDKEVIPVIDGDTFTVEI